MSSKVAISVKNISKCYEIYAKPHHRLFQSLLHGRKQFYKEFWALKDISFEVKKGECIGIVGRNGCGKSTLLQIIAGTLTPTSGDVEVHGRVAALLELGSGFNSESTGRENVYINGTVLGLSRQEIDERFDDIAKFADIGEFIEQPVKTYSSGMLLRLAFAVIVHIDAEVLIIDEALAVGDVFFVQKCMRFLRNFMKNNTLIFVSHDTAAVNNLCDTAILLKDGIMKCIGAAKNVTETYLEEVYSTNHIPESKAETVNDAVKIDNVVHDEVSGLRDMRLDFINSTNFRNDIEVFDFIPNADSFGEKGAEIIKVEFLDANGLPLSWIVGGEMVCVRVVAQIKQVFERPIIGFCIKDKLGQYLFGENTFFTYCNRPVKAESEDILEARFTFYMPRLQNGDYSINAAIADGTQLDHVQHHWIHDALFFRSHATSAFLGLLALPMKNISLEIRK